MATEAAWLNGNKLTERRKSKCPLTSTGLLMEGPRKANQIQDAHSLRPAILAFKCIVVIWWVALKGLLLKDRVMCILLANLH